MAQADVLLPSSIPTRLDEAYDTSLLASYASPSSWSSSAPLPIERQNPTFLDMPGTGISSVLASFEHEIRETPLLSTITPPSGPIRIGELPLVHSEAPEGLVRSRVLQAVIDAEMDEPNAERAFFVADLSVVHQQYTRWLDLLPEIEPYYAVKCNPDPYVLRLLAALGAGFDCASHGEIKQVLDLEVPVNPSKIIFANPCKSVSFIRSAAKLGVNTMTFDNTDELYKVARVNRDAKMVVRILTDDSKSLCRLGLKFGAPLDTVPHLLRTAADLGLDVVGVSFHVGSGNYDPSAFSDAVKRAAIAFQMGLDAGFNFTLLDVGGGFESGHFDATAKNLREALRTWFPKSMRELRGIKVIAEPGRYFVAEAFRLAAHVIARRAGAKELPGSQDVGLMSMDMEDIPPSPSTVVDDEPFVNEGGVEEGDQPKVMYYINEGVYGAFNCIMFDHQKVTPYPLTLRRSPIASPGAIAGEHTLLSSVWGPTCDSIDLVTPLCKLPSALDVGDWVGFDAMGAYTICAASTFNGFERSEVHYTSGSGDGSDAVRRVLAPYVEI